MARSVAYQVARSVDQAIGILHQWGVVPVSIMALADASRREAGA
jgi:hypothetical protein